MFMQIIEGRVADGAALGAQMDAWVTDLAPGADGWLGSTAGLTADGGFVATARFESQAAAQANSARPEQGEWWAATAPAFDGDVAFTDCPEVDTIGAGGSDDAGFVQVITGRADRSAILPLAGEIEATLRRMRPDVIGGIVGWPGDGTFVQVVYFTSEGEARAAEGADPMSDEDRAARDRLMGMMEFHRYIDLHQPMLYSR